MKVQGMSVIEAVNEWDGLGAAAMPLRDPEVRIQPRWWSGSPALPVDQFTIDAGGAVTSRDWLAEGSALAARMRQVFTDTGLVHVVNTGLTQLADMRMLGRVVLDAEMAYEGGANPRGDIEPNVYEIGAPLEAWLHYHHEMAYVSKSTRMLGFLCRQQLPGRGHTYFSDNVQATDAILKTQLGQKLKDKGLCYHRILSDREHFNGREEIGVYNHWQKSFGTEDREVAEAKARERGLVTKWAGDGSLVTRFYASAFEYFPPLDRNLMFASVADHSMWFDAWPRVAHLPHDQRPLKLTFGDDTELTRAECEEWVDVYDRFGIPVDWRVGDVVVFCNYRFAHGRPAIHLREGEQRQLGVLLGETFDRVGALPGKW
jgi:hypothetical protein